jgi:hypothetical protein
MQWEILVAVIIAIGICTAILEARVKRMAHKDSAKTVQSKQGHNEKPRVS